MRVIKSELITDAVKKMCIDANCFLPEDVKCKIKEMHKKETNEMAKGILSKCIKNFELAQERKVPICQDTGMAVVFVEMGDEVFVEGNINDAINEGVRQGYDEGYLRKSVVKDPLSRVNTNDNTPAMINLEVVKGDKITITVAPKGFGSENMSAVKMLKPSDGVDGVIDFVIETVKKAGANPCPPIVIGVGVGGTFDKAAYLAKKALTRDIGQLNNDEYYADLEKLLLQKVNELDIGPQGFGGDTTALNVAIEYLPTHIAGLPCAVNINCHVARHMKEVL